jgi:hypothetical protein
MHRVAFLTIVACIVIALCKEGQAGCRPKPHGPYGGPCYACGGPGLARGYPQGYYGFGSWGYGPGYALGNYGYGSGFAGGACGDDPGSIAAYYGPGYQSGYPWRRGYCLVAYYFGSAGYLHRPAVPRDCGGEYGGILPPGVWSSPRPAAAPSSTDDLWR